MVVDGQIDTSPAARGDLAEDAHAAATAEELQDR
jgi:hypothetical protein